MTRLLTSFIFAASSIALFAHEAIVIEAESIEGANVAEEARASGGKVATGLGHGNELVLKDIEIEEAGRYTLKLETFDRLVRGVGISVNGAKFVSKQIAPGYDNTAGVGFWDVKLKAGKNEIRFANGQNDMPSLDRITIERALEVTDAPGRKIIDFNRDWRFHWGRKGKEAHGIKFDDSSWETVDLPHDAQFTQPWGQKDSNGARGFKPMGDAWYRKTFTLEDLGIDIKGRRVYLELGGLLCVGDVYLNGNLVGSTEYGYLPVWADLTEKLRESGTNVISVWCSTRQAQGSRWYTGSGLYRDAKIVVLPQVSIARHGIFVKSCAKGKDAAVAVSVELDGFAGKGNKAKLDVEATVRDAEGNEVARTSSLAPWSKNDHQEVALPEATIKDVKLWDVDAPNLYTAEVRLVYNGKEIDRESVRFGVRTIELDYEYGLKLNGKKIFLRSMSGHHDLGCLGAAAYPRAIRRQFEQMKAFGYNAIRCSHCPYSEDFYDLADEMGLLVLDELIDKWSDHSYWFGRRPFSVIWPELVTEWMKRDRNHPSIFAWSFGNELQMRNELCGYQGLNDWGVTMYRVIKALSQRWDDTRPTTVAMFPSRAGALYKNDPGFWDDPHAPELALATDFAALNYQSTVYKDYVRNAPGLNIFQSEATVNERLGPWVDMDMAHSIGVSYWGAIEYWGESNSWPKKGWNFSFFSHTLEPYPTAWLIKSGMLPDEPIAEIAVSTGRGESVDWNDVKVGTLAEAQTWEGEPGKMKDVRIYTNCKEVELFLNGKSLGKKANDAVERTERNIVKYAVPFEAGQLTVKGIHASGSTVSSSVRTAGEAVRLNCTCESGKYFADGRDLIYVRCYAVDKDGVRVRTYDGKVSFACTGAATFLACDNGDHYTDELFTSNINEKRTKDGFILGVMRCGTKPGEAKITIKAEGFADETITCQIH